MLGALAVPVPSTTRPTRDDPRARLGARHRRGPPRLRAPDPVRGDERRPRSEGSLGTETVARMLGLRVNHRADRTARASSRSRRPAPRPPTRSPACSRSSPPRSTPCAAPPRRSPSCARSVAASGPRRALRFVGSPYVWAGTSSGRSSSAAGSARRLRLLRLRLARVQARALRGRARARDGAPEADDLCDERRGPALRPGRSRGTPAGRRRLLRLARHALEARRGRPHGHLPRERLDGALVRPRDDPRPHERLVRDPLRVGSGRSSRPASRTSPPQAGFSRRFASSSADPSTCSRSCLIRASRALLQARNSSGVHFFVLAPMMTSTSSRQMPISSSIDSGCHHARRARRPERPVSCIASRRLRARRENARPRPRSAASRRPEH